MIKITKKVIIAIIAIIMVLGTVAVMTGCKDNNYVFDENDFKLTVAIAVNGQMQQEDEPLVANIGDMITVMATFYNLTNQDVRV